MLRDKGNGDGEEVASSRLAAWVLMAEVGVVGEVGGGGGQPAPCCEKKYHPATGRRQIVRCKAIRNGSVRRSCATSGPGLGLLYGPRLTLTLNVDFEVLATVSTAASELRASQGSC